MQKYARAVFRTSADRFPSATHPVRLFLDCAHDSYCETPNAHVTVLFYESR